MSLLDSKKWTGLANENLDSFFIFQLAKRNRIEKTKPVRAANWCGGCDRAYIRTGSKCPVCGNRDKSKHAKK